VALLTLPTIWKDFTPEQIADSVPPALFSMLGADVIYVSSPGLLDEAVQVIRTSETISPEFYPNVPYDCSVTDRLDASNGHLK
jgi:hypothetical protein